MGLLSNRVVSTDTPDLKHLDWQKWEMDSISEEDGEHEGDNLDDSILDHEEEIEEHHSVPAVSEEELLAIKNQAHQEGFETGRREGHQAGVQQGIREGINEGREKGYQAAYADARAELDHLKEIMSQLESLMGQVECDVPEQIMKMSVALASRMFQEALRVRPELILPVVRKAVSSLPYAITEPVLVLSPRDAALVKKHLQAELVHSEWEIVEDPNMTDGGFLVRSTNSELDATVETRWNQIIETLGQEDDGWLK